MGGSDPTFSAFSRPKSVLGSLPPCSDLHRCRILGIRCKLTRLLMTYCAEPPQPIMRIRYP